METPISLVDVGTWDVRVALHSQPRVQIVIRFSDYGEAEHAYYHIAAQSDTVGVVLSWRPAGAVSGEHRKHKLLRYVSGRAYCPTRETESMSKYVAFYRGRKMEVEAETSRAAQLKAAAIFKARKEWEVSVVLCDTPIDPASLG